MFKHAKIHHGKKHWNIAGICSYALILEMQREFVPICDRFNDLQLYAEKKKTP